MNRRIVNESISYFLSTAMIVNSEIICIKKDHLDINIIINNKYAHT